MQSNIGRLITLEGCEGVGKSTQIELLKAYCEEKKIDAVFTREPGGTIVAEKIRDIILDTNSDIERMTELLLYSAARVEHLFKIIKPALEKGKLVFCDRFIDSTTAYQGYGRGIDLGFIEYLNKSMLKIVSIDTTFFLDLSPECGFNRKGGADKNDRIDSESLDFHERVYKGFKEIVKNNKRIVTIDAKQDKYKILKQICKSIKI
ncbi:MAG: dTMP kinase [Firmicutes bacterium]|nr:dTMP kinase [Bacillota bacterium]